MNKSTKVLISTVSTILALIVICVIILSCIPKNYNFNLSTDYDRIAVKINGNENPIINQKDKEKEIMNLYNESFKTSMISALFNGKAFEGKTLSESHSNVSSLTNSGYWLVINYGSNEQTISEETTSANSKKYDKVYIQVLDSDDYTLITAYLTSSSTSSSNYKYTTYAKQSSLYDYLAKFAQ